MSTRKTRNQEYNYAFSEEELINMHRSRFDMKDCTLFKYQILFWIIPNLWMESYIFYETAIVLRTYFLTLLGVSLVTISWMISTYITYAKIKGVEVSYKLRRLNHLWFEVTFSIQILITIVYWTVLHIQSQEYFKSRGPYFVYYMIWVHTVPMIWIGAEYLLTSQIVFLRDLKYIILFGLIYSLNNFLQTKLIEGRRPYPFMTWKSWDSLVSVGVILIFFAIMYFITAKLTQKLSKNIKNKED